MGPGQDSDEDHPADMFQIGDDPPCHGSQPCCVRVRVRVVCGGTAAGGAVGQRCVAETHAAGLQPGGAAARTPHHTQDTAPARARVWMQRV